MNLINGLNRKNIEDVEWMYYSNNMLKDNLIVVVNNYESIGGEKEWGIETWISVYHYNDLDAFSFTLYQGDYLQSIQVYRIVKDIYDLYLDNKLPDFLKIIKDLSVAFQSQSMQSKKENARDVREWIVSEFATIN
ncbi:hypothetical protein [Ornithinibacillus sp. JPR2-1]|uniref:hypothetical protein n=1 Tax=Ornithinibacillus sp. JPR2-1 TaxID=2094019 RepID=UPI0031E3F587